MKPPSGPPINGGYAEALVDDLRRARLLQQIQPFDGVFLHAVPLNDIAACHNLSLSGRLFSAEYGAVVDEGIAAEHESVRDVPLDALASSGPAGPYQPFAAWRVWAAAIIRSGGHVGVNALAPAWMSESDERSILHAGDVELAFEAGRRTIAPDAASRLTSIFVTDDTVDGRRHLDEMFRGSADRYVVKVTIPAAIRATRTDTRWFERYSAGGDQADIEHYWRGDAFDPEVTAWEYLVEGVIEVTDERQLRYIDRAGAAPDLSSARTGLRRPG